MNKKDSRIRRATKTRAKIKSLEVPRLTVHKTPRHTYAQLIAADNKSVLAAASTLNTELKSELKNGANIDAAKLVGKAIAEKIKSAGITKVAFDRSGFKYHGRIKALADSARENGLDF
jgi:large subunit ribosomal protein L18